MYIGPTESAIERRWSLDGSNGSDQIQLRQLELEYIPALYKVRRQHGVCKGKGMMR
jgi:hypothetical protein